MVITVLEALVQADKTDSLKAVYQQATQHLDEGISQTFLLHSTKDPGIWQIVTIWQSRAALEKMRQSGEKPRGVLIFREAGAEPKLTVYEVIANASE